MKIAVVDDDMMSLRGMYTNLSIEFDVDCYSCPKEALKKIESGESYDLIISDYKMGEMDGIAFLKKARNLFDVKTALFTGFSTAKLVEDVKQSSIDLFFEKPINLEVLIKEIVKLKVRQ